ncbi:uncharacterized protein LOC143915141 isoform X5 [Arctopsyche grandis]|uniref:uncharacterized protein LOC143915141 isoform X5 n=1 Tax=Arctopsyche grandis TaxID=121162 RepID=UPI00406D75B8
MEERLCPCPAPVESSIAINGNPFPRVQFQVKKEDELSATICPGANPQATGCNSPVNDDIHEQNNKSSAFEWSESKQNICSIKNTCGGKVTSSDFKKEDTHDIETSLPTDSIYKKYLSDSELSHEIKFECTSDSESTLQLHQENVKTEYELPSTDCNYSVNDDLYKQESSILEWNESQPNLSSIENLQIKTEYKLSATNCNYPVIDNSYKQESSAVGWIESKQNLFSIENVKTEYELPVTDLNYPVNDNLHKRKSSSFERIESKQNLYSIENMCGGQVTRSDFKMNSNDNIESILPTTSNYKKCVSNSESSYEMHFEHTSNGESTLQLYQEKVIQFENEHTGEKPYKCDICFKSFALSYSLFIHKKDHRIEEKQYKCDICLKSFNQKSQLTKHERSHSEEKPFKCDLCSKSFALKAYFLRHVKYHNAKKRHKCNICWKSYVRKSELDLHKLYHLNAKPHKCNICPKSFVQKHHLINHKRTHTGEKPYKCDICFKSFAIKSYIAEHKRTHSGEKPYKCDICLKSYCAQSNLLRHIKSHTEKMCKKNKTLV